MHRQFGMTQVRWHCLLGLSALLMTASSVTSAAATTNADKQASSRGIKVRQAKIYTLPAGLSAEEWQEVRQLMRPARLAETANSNRSGSATGANTSAYQNEKTAPPQSNTGRLQGGNGAILQTDYIKAFNPDQSDYAGHAIAMSGDTLVVGAYAEDSSGVGVDGNPSNNSVGDSGAAYVFTRTAQGWQQEAYLKAANAGSSDYFGFAVAISGETIVVGALYEDTSNGGINPTVNNSLSNSGAAYIFTRNNGQWVQEAMLKASNPDSNDEFGVSVAISDTTIVVGARYEDGSSSGVNSAQNNNATNAGAAYVFVKNASTWSQQAYLKASNPDSSDYFGYDVAISANSIIVGSYAEDSPTSVINGSQTNNTSYNDSGAAYVFTRSGTVWSQQAYLKPPNVQAGDQFGISVDISGDRAIVGAQQEDSSAVGVNGDLFSDSTGNAGAAYIFERNNSGSWYFRDYLKATNTGNSDYFGSEVSISGDFALVGAYAEDSNGTGVDDASNDMSANSGAAYLYILAEGSTQAAAYLKPSNTDSGDEFGFATALSGGVLAVGARYEDGGSNQPNGNDINNDIINSGAAYIFAGATNFHPVGGTVIGLAEGNELLLRNSDGQSLRVDVNGSFRFPLQYTDGTSYDVVVEEAPIDPLQDCFVNNGDGIIDGVAVSSILIDCSFRTLSIPRSLNTVDSGEILVPVRVSPNGASIGSLAFSIDYDETCLTPDADGDGQLDDVAFSVPIDFSPSIQFNPLDTDGEIDISIADVSAPISALVDGTVVTIRFTADCPATQGANRIDNEIKFSVNPAPSFGDLGANDIEGTLSEGVVRVWAGNAGDCNVGGNVTAADLTAIGLEIFDADGDYFVDAPNSDYFGSPMGCDANGNETINAADVTCANLLIFGDACEPLRTAQSLSKPEINTRVDQEQDRVWLRVDLNQQQEVVAAVAFSLELDQHQFDLSQFDLDRNGVPDLVNYPLGQPGVAMVNWHADGTTAVIDILLADRASNELPQGMLLEIGIPTAQVPKGGVRYSQIPAASFSNNTGADLQGVLSLGDIIFQDYFESR